MSLCLMALPNTEDMRFTATISEEVDHVTAAGMTHTGYMSV